MTPRLGIIVCVGVVCLGCRIQVSPPAAVPPGTFAVRIAANSHDHERVIELARSTTDNQVVENGRLVAEWLPLWPGGSAEKGLSEIKDVISREKPHGREILVVHGVSDITEQDTAGASYIADVEARHCVYVELTKNGSKSIASLTTSHLPDESTGFHRRVAMIVKGRVYSLPQIKAVVYEVGMEAVSKRDAEQLERLLNGASG